MELLEKDEDEESRILTTESPRILTTEGSDGVLIRGRYEVARFARFSRDDAGSDPYHSEGEMDHLRYRLHCTCTLIVYIVTPDRVAGTRGELSTDGPHADSVMRLVSYTYSTGKFSYTGKFLYVSR